MRERRFGAAGDRLVIEECLAGPEVSFFVRQRRRARACRSARRRITSGSSTTIADRTRAGWARSRRARSCDAALHGARHARDRRPGDRRDGRRGPSVSRVSVRRPDADGGRSEGDRVQRAARRSRGAGDPAAHRRTARCRCSLAAATGQLRRIGLPARQRSRCRRRARVARLPRVVGVGTADRRHRARPRRFPACRSITRAPRCATASSSPPAAVC